MLSLQTMNAETLDIARKKVISKGFLDIDLDPELDLFAEIERLNGKLRVENSRMSAELEITQRLQQMILPRDEELRAITNLDISGSMEAMDFQLEGKDVSRLEAVKHVISEFVIGLFIVLTIKSLVSG